MPPVQATISITGGTGAYRGIAGHGEYAFNDTFIFAHTPTGCSKNVTRTVIIVHAGGPVSLGS
jgi:hypothetical protein